MMLFLARFNGCGLLSLDGKRYLFIIAAHDYFSIVIKNTVTGYSLPSGLW
jgi:hypothetical protein